MMNISDWGLSPQETQRVATALQPDEAVVLVVKPKARMHPVEILARMVPGVAVLIFFGCALTELKQLWWMVLLMGTPFILLGVCSLLSPWWHRRRMERTLYLLTNRRVVVLEPGVLFGERMIAYPLQPNPVKEVDTHDDGYGNIVFAYEMRWQWHTRRIHRAPCPVGFIAVPQVERVAQMIAEQVAATPTSLPSLPAVPPALAGLPTETDSWGNPTPQHPNSGVLIAFGAAFALFALLFMGMGVYRMQQEARFEEEGVRTTATVVEVKARRNSSSSSHRHRSSGGITIRVGDSRKSRNSYNYYPVFRFTDTEGRVHEAESDTGSSDYNYPAGYQVPVIYLPSDPTKVTPADASAKTGLLFTLIGGLVFVIGVGVLAGGIVMKKKN